MAGTNTAAVIAYHGTLDGSDPDTITIKNHNQTLTILNRSGSSAIYFRCDGSTAAIAADFNYVIPGVTGALTVNVPQWVFGQSGTVSLTAAASVAYSVEVI